MRRSRQKNLKKILLIFLRETFSFLDLCLTSTHPLSCTLPSLFSFGCMFTIDQVISSKVSDSRFVYHLEGKRLQRSVWYKCFKICPSWGSLSNATENDTSGELLDSPSVFLFLYGCLTKCPSAIRFAHKVILSKPHYEERATLLISDIDGNIQN